MTWTIHCGLFQCIFLIRVILIVGSTWAGLWSVFSISSFHTNVTCVRDAIPVIHEQLILFACFMLLFYEAHLKLVVPEASCLEPTRSIMLSIAGSPLLVPPTSSKMARSLWRYSPIISSHLMPGCYEEASSSPQLLRRMSKTPLRWCSKR